MQNTLETQVVNNENRTSIEALKDSYNEFVDSTKHRTSEISDIINESELNNIKDIIVSFKMKIEEYGVKKEPTATDKIVNRLSLIPIIGGYIEAKAEQHKVDQQYNKNIRQTLQEMFTVFKEKAEYLEIVYKKAYELRNDLIGREQEIERYSLEVQNTIATTDNPLEKVQAIALGALVEGNKLKTKEKIYNKLDFILKFIEEQLTVIALQLPGIEASLTEDVAITSFLNNISDMNSMFSSLTELSNNVSRMSSESVQSLITEVSESMSSGIDINHLEKLAQRNQQFMTKMIATQKNKITKDVSDYQKLTQMSEKLTSNILEYNATSQKVLIESSSKLDGIVRAHPTEIVIENA